MRTYDSVLSITNEVSNILSGVAPGELDGAVRQITESNAVFVAGTGRSLLMLKAFAMRLMHFGLNAHVVGETTTPAITERDLLVAASGSGETETVLLIAKKAVTAGATLLAITANRESSLSSIAGNPVIIPARSKNDSAQLSWQPSGNSFEQSLLLVLDGIAITVSERHGISLADKLRLHANLE